MRHEYRVTKYDPRFRDPSGCYTRSEWTSISDIGRVFDGHRASMREYLRAEQGYLSVLEAMLTEAGVTRLELFGLEDHETTRRGQRHRWRERDRMSIPRAIEFARRALREDVWGMLVAPRRAFVHFGYDYYMYVGLSRRTPRAIAAAPDQGIFVEYMRSPYASTARRLSRRRP